MANRRASNELGTGNGSLRMADEGLPIAGAGDKQFTAVHLPDNAQEEPAEIDLTRRRSHPDQGTSDPPVSPLEPEAQNKRMAPAEEEVDSCRICRSEGTSDQPLFYPCKCSGSIKYVHQECLMEWLSHTQKKYCELCKTPFTFTKLYDGSMPQTLPLLLFIGQLLLLGFNAVLRWSRFTMVTFVWLIWLPWSIRQVWRGLFWLADGSWVAPDGIDLHALLENGTSVVLTTLAPATPTTSSTAAGVTNEIPQEGGPIAAFLSFTTSELLVVKLLRLVYPNVYQILKAVFSDGTFPEPDLNRQRRTRLPSLLSDVTYFKTLTSYTVLNNAIMDVLEGQLVCLLIVTAFILVFLIREWVINQQPAAAMPDPDRPDVPVAPLQQDQQHGAEGARQVNRRRRRGFRVVPDQRERAQVAVQQVEMQELNPIVGRGQQGREPIVAPTNPPASVRPGLSRSGTEEQRSQPTGSSHAHPEESESKDSKAGDLHSRSPLLSQQEQRPTLRAVHGLDEAVDIRRMIEENSTDSTTATSGSHMLPSQRARMVIDTEQASTPENTESNARCTRPSAEQEQPRLETMQSSFAEKLAHRLDGAAESEDLFENPPTEDARALEHHVPAPILDEGPTFNPQDDQQDFDSITADDTPTVLPTPSTEGEEPVDTPTTSEDDGPVEVETGPAPRPETLFGRVADWMWHTDGPVPEVAEHHHHHDDVHVVHDIDNEAPFVPVAPHPGLHEPVHDPARVNADGPDGAEPPAVPADNIFGVDPNDPNAIEEAEDLEGILELIGMRGPIINMIQNVIFSEVLITLTIAASVWLPYIWGKITLLILANPVDVFIKAPLHIISKVADAIVDIMLFVAGSLLHAVNMTVNWLVKAAAGLLPDLISRMDTSKYGAIALKMANGSQARLQKSVSITLSGLRPDLPTFSILSHQALRYFENQLSEQTTAILGSMTSIYERIPAYFEQLANGNLQPLMETAHTNGIIENVRKQATLAMSFIVRTTRTMSIDLAPRPTEEKLVLDVSLVRWDTRDKIVAIVLGYAFLSCIGYAYLKITRLIFGTRPGDKAEGIIADSLRQAGGVAKVILIIGIEMIAFPLYCGLLLDFALMPLFPGVTFQSRCAFIMDAPMTALFVHWFIGTCYMFHFALFVSMCRKVMRKGVLYFIRDPDDPTFHPVRDVLERPVAGQLSKIAFSAIVYGGLVMACLGGVIWVLTCIDGVLPINWLGNEPKLELPIDVLFYNFFLPFLMRKVEPSTKIAAMWEWWFRGCARNLRLTHFMFDEVKDDERGTWQGMKWNPWTQRREGPQYFHRDGTFVRAPASDSVRIPKGDLVFLEVNENNERTEDEEVNEDGPHGRKNKNFAKIYIPPDFRARIATFIFLIWLFAATTGILFTIGPMLVGRKAIRLLTQSDEPPNDLYAFTIGVHICGALAYAAAYAQKAKQWIMKKAAAIINDQGYLIQRCYQVVTYILGLAYLLTAFGIILPFLFSMVSELYILLPLYTYLTSADPSSSQPPGLVTPPTSIEQRTSPTTIHVLQTWTLGLLYLRLVLRLAMGYPCQHTRCAAAMRSILRNGILHPEVKLATRAFILPAFILSTILLLAPLAWGWSINTIFEVQQTDLRIKVFRYAYPGLMAIMLVGYCAYCLKRQIGLWRVKIRDEVYLIGERLHNYGDKGKGKQRATIERTATGSQRVEVID